MHRFLISVMLLTCLVLEGSCCYCTNQTAGAALEKPCLEGLWLSIVLPQPVNASCTTKPESGDV